MSSALATIGQNGVAPSEWDRERIEFVRRTFCGGAPDATASTFIEICRRRGLSPEEKQVYLVPRRSGGQVNWVIQTGIDGYRALAARTGTYAGSDDPIFAPGGDLENGKAYPAKATVTVWRLVAGTRCPFTASALWDEYNAGQSLWLKMPHTMLGKCAEALALRKAFPAELGAIYTREEMDQAGPEAAVPAFPANASHPADDDVDRPRFERGRNPDDPGTPQQKARITVLMRACGLNPLQVKELALEACGKERGFTVGDAEKVIAKLQSLADAVAEQDAGGGSGTLIDAETGEVVGEAGDDRHAR